MTSSSTILTIRIEAEPDIVLTRGRARQLAGLMGYDDEDQTRIAAAVSEIARNALRHGHGGHVELAAEPSGLVVTVRDRGPGIEDVQAVLDGRGEGLGLVAARRLMDAFSLESGPNGTTVVMGKTLQSRRRLTPADLATALARESIGPESELTECNRKLLEAYKMLQERQAEIERLSLELEETNRGVVALYSELDDKAQALARASDMKSRFLSHMSHEFRTPLAAIINISQMVIDRLDGPLTSEQDKQLHFIRDAANDLWALVSDLLDLARIEAGVVVVRPVPIEAALFMAALRGMFRALVTQEKVALTIEVPASSVELFTDEFKLSQILRNLISNALKFTEKGEVRVHVQEREDQACFQVADTGIGIAEEDQVRIFQEFAQIDSAMQRKVRGTGLGLPLSRKLAQLLGGDITVVSEPGKGSTFTLCVPKTYKEPQPPAERAEAQRGVQ